MNNTIYWTYKDIMSITSIYKHHLVDSFRAYNSMAGITLKQNASLSAVYVCHVSGPNLKVVCRHSQTVIRVVVIFTDLLVFKTRQYPV